MIEAALITEDYRRMQAELHRNPQYGVASVGYAIMKRFRLARFDRIQKRFAVVGRKID